MPASPLQQVAEEHRRALLVEAARGLDASPDSLRIETFLASSGVVDETLKLRVSDEAGRAQAIVLWSNAAAPEMATRGAQAARDAAQAMSEDAAKAVVLPIAEGRVDGRAFTVTRMMVPLRTGRISGRVDRWRVAPRVFAWLGEVVASTAREADSASTLRPALAYLADEEALPEGVRAAGRRAADRLEAGSWVPRFAVMHGDLWAGNVMIDPRRDEASWADRFVVIDWASGTVHGPPVYDLIRLARSMGTSRRRLRVELERHCQVLGCELEDARSYLAAGLGHIGLHRGEFPLDRYAELAAQCLALLDRSLGPRP